jgi:hypothetical protein
MQDANETGMDEAHCESDPHCWNGTELQHLATFPLWQISEKSYHKDTTASASILCLPEAMHYIINYQIKCHTYLCTYSWS